MGRYSHIMLAAAGMFALSSFSALADDPSLVPEEHPEMGHKIVHVGEGEDLNETSQREIINNFYYDQFRHYQDPMAPYFMLLSRDGKLGMGIGGAVAVQGFYDWNGSMPTAGFIPYNIPVKGDPYSRSRYGTSISGTTIFARVFGRSNTIGTYHLYIEAKFSSEHGGQFLLNKAYATVNDWTLGYASSSFSDPAAEVPTVDQQGPNSEISNTNILLRWMHTYGRHLVAAVSIESPDIDIPTLEGRYKGCSAFMPDVAGFVQYQWKGIMQHVRLAGIIRGLEYRNLVTDKNKKVAGWGAHLSTVLNPVQPVKIYGAFELGQGIGSLVDDLQNAPLDLQGNLRKPGDMYAPLSLGWYTGVQYFFTPKVFSTVMYSQTNFLARHQPTVDNDLYKYGQYVTANVFWNPTPRLTFAAEYNYGYRRDFDGAGHGVNRVSLLAKYSF